MISSTMPEQTELHAFEYQHEGATWIMEVRATSQADAWQRICRLQEGTYLGVVHMKLPARASVFGRVACFLANALGR